MDKFELIESLRKKIHAPLPAHEAQYKMAAYYKNRFSEDEIVLRNPKIGAVMILLIWENKEWKITLMLRPPYDGTHGGQISFFGGKQEKGDLSLLETAKRETHEEAGIHLNSISEIGALSPLYIEASNYLVQPFLFFAHEQINFVPDEKEVEEIFFIPLQSFYLNKKETEINLKNGLSFKAPAYIHENKIIWGATAMILSELEAILVN